MYCIFNSQLNASGCEPRTCDTPVSHSIDRPTYDVSVAGWYNVCTCVPQKQFWIIALLSLYSVVFHDYSLAASFFNTVNTMEENGNR